MRLDKFLKVSHIIKRRTLAKEAADRERVYINSKTAKPSSLVKEGDVIEIRYAQKTLKFKVLNINEYTSKSDSSSMYEVISNE